MGNYGKLKVLRLRKRHLEKRINEVEDAIFRIEAQTTKPVKKLEDGELGYSKKEGYGQIIESVASALCGRKKYAIHYKKLAERLELDPDQVAVALFTLKERGEVVCVRRGYYRGA